MIDPAIVDRATAAYWDVIDAEKAAGLTAGDHYAEPGLNERIWNSFQKLAERAPETFAAYFACPSLDLICSAWLGPAYRMTAQVNVVRPGGSAQRPHRDYHLGFLSDEQAARYPIAMHRASVLLTLQGDRPACSRSPSSTSSGSSPTATRSSSATSPTTSPSSRCGGATASSSTTPSSTPLATTARPTS
jgi:hypothetical protein